MNDRDQLIEIIHQALLKLDPPLPAVNEDPHEIPEIIADAIINAGWPRR